MEREINKVNLLKRRYKRRKLAYIFVTKWYNSQHVPHCNYKDQELHHLDSITITLFYMKRLKCCSLNERTIFPSIEKCVRI